MAAETLLSLKRPAHFEERSETQPRKKIKVQRRLHHVQERPQNIEPAPQDPIFVQGQLLRSISAALAMVGFDSVKPTALEMFRACVEEYMLKFLHNTRTSMHTSRRTKPTPIDFASALALTPNTSRASLLTPQLHLSIPEAISYPSIPDPDLSPAPQQDFSALLDPPIAAQPPRPYIPHHFPQLPPKHSWEHTPVYSEREKDARKMREKATEEGMQAEQALRKLAAAAKSGAVRVEKRRERGGVLSGPGRKVGRGKERARPEDAEAMFADMIQQVGGGGDRDEQEDAMDLGAEGRKELRGEGVDVGMPEGVVVNWDMGGWRRGGRRRLRL